jgi:hypothetical protein
VKIELPDYVPRATLKPDGVNVGAGDTMKRLWKHCRYVLAAWVLSACGAAPDDTTVDALTDDEDALVVWYYTYDGVLLQAVYAGGWGGSQYSRDVYGVEYRATPKSGSADFILTATGTGTTTTTTQHEIRCLNANGASKSVGGIQQVWTVDAATPKRVTLTCPSTHPKLDVAFAKFFRPRSTGPVVRAASGSALDALDGNARSYLVRATAGNHAAIGAITKGIQFEADAVTLQNFVRNSGTRAVSVSGKTSTVCRDAVVANEFRTYDRPFQVTVNPGSWVGLPTAYCQPGEALFFAEISKM